MVQVDEGDWYTDYDMYDTLEEAIKGAKSYLNHSEVTQAYVWQEAEAGSYRPDVSGDPYFTLRS